MLIILQIWDNFYMISLQVLNKKKEIARRKYQDSRFPTVQHNHGYWGTFRNYSGIFWTLCNPGIFKTLGYSEPWHIQNHRHIKTPSISKTLAHSEPNSYSGSCDIQNRRHTQNFVNIFESYNYFCNLSFSCLLVHETNMIFIMQV